jgi:aryl carrier-like protein
MQPAKGELPRAIDYCELARQVRRRQHGLQPYLRLAFVMLARKQLLSAWNSLSHARASTAS